MILTVTLNPAVDEEYIIPELRPGGWLRATSRISSPGGKGINISTILAQFGYPSAATGFLAGMKGEYIRSVLRSYRITTNFVHIPGENRTNVYIIDEAGNLETSISEAGPTVSPEAVDRLRKVYGRIFAAHKVGNTWRNPAPGRARRNLRRVCTPRKKRRVFPPWLTQRPSWRP